MRMSATIVMVVVIVLVVLRTSSAQGKTTISTTTLTTTSECPIPPCAVLIGCIPVPGPDGCPICACPDYNCQNRQCGPDQECVMEDVGCPPETTPCFPQPKCIPSYETTTSCPMFKCLPSCVPGRGSDGCPTCDCPRTCEDISCTKDEECVLQQVVCKKLPCFPEPTCVPRNDSCTGTPNTKRCGWSGIKIRWFYNSTANACQKFRYYGCTPSSNTFVSRKACEDKCKRTDPLICLDVVCEDDCYTFKRRNQCPQCICPNPCKDFMCSAGEECKLREVTCSEKICIPQPFCDPKSSCPDQDQCMYIRCAYGIKTDENGCSLCECVEQPQA